jgi:lipopolysaccharide export system protein LptA
VKRLTPILSCLFSILLLGGSGSLFAQINTGDSMQQVDILNYTKRLTFQTIDDSTQLTIIAGDVALRQGTTLFYCDSCVINNRTNIFEAWGKTKKIHINDSDTTHIYSSHLRYLMAAEIAYLNGGVRLTDGHATLTTPDLEYDMESNIGIYKNGGKVVNKKTVLTSQEGWYYADMKDIYFKKNVLLIDPAYKIATDSMIYNSELQTTRFISMTTITDSSGRIIKTREGYYNQRTGQAEFGQRPIIVDGDIEAIGDRARFDDSTGISQLEGNAMIVDKKNKTTIIAGAIFRNKKTDAILAIRKPLMIIQQDNDSIYISADTLFSARLTDLYASRASLGMTVNLPDSMAGPDSTQVGDRIDTVVGQQPGRDTIVLQEQDTEVTPARQDTSTEQRSRGLPQFRKRGQPAIQQDTSMSSSPDSIEVATPRPGGFNATGDSVLMQTTKGVKMVALNEKDSTNRYFEAYRNVRIYNDSLQAGCDSLFYSFKDSVFRLYDDPVVWAQQSQITGDTIHLFTKNKKAEKVEAYENGLVVNRLTDQAFNQVKATRIDGYFVNGDIDSVRAKGYAECIYYIQDEDSAYTGINESTSDIMDIFFRNKELFKVVMRSAVTGTLWPIRDKSPGEMRLKNFRWLEERRPKSKFEMYE